MQVQSVSIASCEVVQLGPGDCRGASMPVVRLAWWSVRDVCVCVCLFYQPCSRMWPAILNLCVCTILILTVLLPILTCRALTQMPPEAGKNSTTHERNLMVISTVGCSMSICGLFVAVIVGYAIRYGERIEVICHQVCSP